LNRRVYLDNQPVDRALDTLLSALPEGWGQGTCIATVATGAAINRVLARPVVAAISAPHYHGSAMDGIALRAADTFGASPARPLRLKEPAFRPVDTGDPIPDGCDAVVMIEDVVVTGEGEVEIAAPARPWQHVRSVGEDVVEGTLLFSEGHRLAPQDIGHLLTAGVFQVDVMKRPRVALIPTGTEIVTPEAVADLGQQGGLKPGAIIESNTAVQAGLVLGWGGEPIRRDPVPDDREQLLAALKAGVEEADIIVMNAGSSAGTEDYTAWCIEQMGAVLVHGVAMKPGKPVILGVVDGKPVIGCPGYPVSAYLGFHLFVRSLVYRLQGLEPPEPEQLTARVARALPSRLGQDEFIRVVVVRVGNDYIAHSLNRGAGVTRSLALADGFVRIGPLSQGLGAGSRAPVELIRGIDGRAKLERGFLILGAHDPALERLAESVKAPGVGAVLRYLGTGSGAGLQSLAKGLCHGAATSLIDADSGEYLHPAALPLLAGTGEADGREQERHWAVVEVARRQQGLIVPLGNPQGVNGLADLARDDLRFANRPLGSGTRALLDYLLGREGIDHQDVSGYRREKASHLAVAAAVKSGSATVGLGCRSAAKALGLDFVPLWEEPLKLVLSQEDLVSSAGKALLAALRSERWRKAAAGLGGYDLSAAGQVEEGSL